MGDEFAELLKRVRALPQTPERQEEHRRSFTYGNVKLENPAVTRELVDQVADSLPPK